MAPHPNHPDQLHFARIEHFARLDVRDNHNASTVSVWTVYVKVLKSTRANSGMAGPHKYGQGQLHLMFFFIPLHFFKNRLAYCETPVSFGRIIGIRTVYIVSLLSN